MAETVEFVVAGAGVVGLAIARQLAKKGREVLVIEAESTIGSQISSRNSEVIHAGIYYPPGSLKARFCVPGRRQLYEFAKTYAVKHQRCGKLIVATSDSQLDRLKKLQNNALANGVDDLQWLDSGQAIQLEPALRCRAALLSPQTGIIDSHGFMLALQGDTESSGGQFAFCNRIAAGSVLSGGVCLDVEGSGSLKLVARNFVNAAGLCSVSLASSIHGLPRETVPEARLARGNYFRLKGRAPFQHLVYPLPEPGGLGVHITLDLAGQARFGPDVEWIDKLDFSVNGARSERFYAEIRKYWPELQDDALLPDYAGIRPKIFRNAVAMSDFLISGPDDHGVPGLVNLFGIESPGLTSSLAIAGFVGAILGQ